MKIRTLRRHVDSAGALHVPGDEYEDTKTNAEQKIAASIVEEVSTKKAVAPENKKTRAAENKKAD